MTGSRDWIPFLKPIVTFKTKEGVEGRFRPFAALVFAGVVCLVVAALPFLLAPPGPR
jgi:hypothetical protein